MILALVVSCVGCGGKRADPGCEALTRSLTALPNRDSDRSLIAQVDTALTTARAQCKDIPAAVRGPGLAHQLARARLADERPADALAQLTSASEPAIAIRRAELLDRLGQTRDALAALAPAAEVDAQAKTQQRLLQVSVAATNGNAAEVIRLVGAAPLPDRPALSHRAAADAKDLGALVSTVPELTQAAADAIEAQHGPAAARAAREMLVTSDPDVAEHWDALARSRIAAGDTQAALAAWDKASGLAPAQQAFYITPIKALVIANEQALAASRVAALAERARKAGNVELLVTASAAAATIADHALALALASEARDKRPTDGNLVVLVGDRLSQSGNKQAAASAYAELLICGAHGKPWHRHEVAAKLLALGDPATVDAALAANRSCAPVEPADLDTYLARLRTR